MTALGTFLGNLFISTNEDINRGSDFSKNVPGSKMFVLEPSKILYYIKKGVCQKSSKSWNNKAIATLKKEFELLFWNL